MKRNSKISVAAAGVLIAAGAAAGCSGGPGSITAHGTVQDCTGALSGGDQVTVADPGGKVLGSGSLTEDNSQQAASAEKIYDETQLPLGELGADTSGMTIYDFTVTGLPGGGARYGISAGNGHNAVWFTPAEMKKGPGLTLGC